MLKCRIAHVLVKGKSMNINLIIANRALEKAGQETLEQSDIENESVKYRLIKNNYLKTILETLSNTEWTSQKKRKRLTVSEQENLTNYAYMYDLPTDCAKPEALLNDGEYIIEGTYLYTDTEDAILMYISNERREIKTTSLELKNATEIEGGVFEYEYYLPSDIVKAIKLVNGELTIEDNILTTDVKNAELVYISDGEEVTESHGTIKDEDYPEYGDFNFDPLLEEYIETRLASKIVLKITGETGLYQLLYAESQLMEKRAIKATLDHSKSKTQGNVWWEQELGLTEKNNANY